MVRRTFLFALALLLLLSPSGFAHEFSYDKLLVAWMKLMGDDYDYTANAESYLRAYRPETWNLVRDDEFKIGREKQKTESIMKAKVKNFDLTQEFTLDTKMRFQTYDFDEKVFPLVTRWSDNSVSKATYWYPESRYPTGTLPYQMRVFFSNPELLASFPMDEKAAEKLVAGRKEWERFVNVRIEFKLLKAREGDGELQAEIKSLIISDTLGKKRVLHKVTIPTKGKKPPAATQEDRRASEGGSERKKAKD